MLTSRVSESILYMLLPSVIPIIIAWFLKCPPMVLPSTYVLEDKLRRV